MSSPELLALAIPRHLSILNKSLALLTNSNIKKALRNAREELAKNKETPRNLNLEIVSEPFFVAFNTDFAKFSYITVDYLSTLFHASTAELFPNNIVTKRAIKVLSYIRLSLSDELRIKSCKLANFILLSTSGLFFVHNENLYNLFQAMLSMYESAKDSINAAEVIEKSLQEMLRAVIGCYDTLVPTPQFQNVENLASYVTKSVVMHCVEAIEVMPTFPERANPHDLDVTTAIRALTTSLEKKMYSTKTNVLALSTLNSILCTNLKYFKKPFFKDILNTDIRVALLASTFDTDFETAAYTASLIETVWSRFSEDFVEGLNEVLDSGLTIALSSPDPHTIRRACHVYRILASTPCIFIDAFVNYDCDHSGYFKNIFENSFALIIKNCYPTTISQMLQKTALTTATTILESLWEFCSNPPPLAIPESVAKNVIAQKEQKTVFEAGLDLFKTSPKKGLKYYIDHNLVENDPVAIGNFLFDTPQLDPAGVGEIIGSVNQAEVRAQFVSRFDFKGLGFEPAFRLFLKKFIIPGEGQMIDRIMEQFGTKYYSENPQFFSCADTVYVLAYSALMLHTDAHHPTIKKHMTLQEFIKNNNGIDNGHNLPVDFLTDLYNGIRREKIFVAASSVPNSALLSREQKAELFKTQCETTLIAAREHTTGADRKFKHCESPLLLGPMMKSVWGRLVAALAISLESSDKPNITQLCLRSMEAAFHISSRCYVEEATQSLLDAFTKFTRMRFADDIPKQKNLDCTRTFLRCVIQDRNYLKTAWSIFFDAVSDMERIKEKPVVGEVLQQAEELFQASVSLDRESIFDFTRAMCEVSSREIEEEKPRYYMLQRIGDVAAFNMNREKIVWNDIWYNIGPHITLAGTHWNAATGAFAVDLLRQLASKFLSKKEMSAFHLQERFLQPFLDIFMGQPTKSVLDLVIDVITRIVTTQHQNLSSGWPVILKILGEAAKTSLIEKSFPILESVLVNYPDDFAPFVVDVLPTLAEFAIGDKTGVISFKSLPFFTVVSGLIKDESAWPVVFYELARVSQHPLPEIKTLALESILEIILKYGCAMKEYSDATWYTILSTSIPEMIDAASDDFQITLINEIYDQIFSFPDALTVSKILLFTVETVKRFGGKKTSDAAMEKFIVFIDGKDFSAQREEIQEIIENAKSDSALSAQMPKLVTALGLN